MQKIGVDRVWMRVMGLGNDVWVSCWCTRVLSLDGAGAPQGYLLRSARGAPYGGGDGFVGCAVRTDTQIIPT